MKATLVYLIFAMQFIIIFLQGPNQLVDYLETKSAGLYVFKYFYQNSHCAEFIDYAKKSI